MFQFIGFLVFVWAVFGFGRAINLASKNNKQTSAEFWGIVLKGPLFLLD